jgi:KaiC/GvpD/RAD55 family RecA-like ATPase
MFKNSIPGLERVFKTDVQAPKVILVVGGPGSMKSAFCYTVMSKYLRNTGEFGLYATLEETVHSHLKNMESLGVEVSLNMQISDFTDLREIDQVVADGDQTNYLAFMEKMVSHYRRVHGNKFSLFALDSLGALYSLMEDSKNMRKKMWHFFKMLRDNNLIGFVILEKAFTGDTHLLGNEGFLVDGIITLGMDRSKGKLVRYLQVEKMRASEHSMERHVIEVGSQGLIVLGPLFDVSG